MGVLFLGLGLSACATDSGPAPSAANPVVEKPRFEPVGGTWESMKRANLRSGPGTDFAVVGGIRPGQTVTVLGRVPGSEWFAVDAPAGTTPDRIAFVRSDLLRQLPPVPAQPQTAMRPVAAPIAPAPVPAVQTIPTPAPTPTPVAVSPVPAPRPPVAAPPAARPTTSNAQDQLRRSEEFLATCRTGLPATAHGKCSELARMLTGRDDPAKGLPAAERREATDYLFTGPGWSGGVIFRQTGNGWSVLSAPAPMSWRIKLFYPA